MGFDHFKKILCFLFCFSLIQNSLSAEELKNSKFKEHQLHIMITCADARDISHTNISALKETLKHYRQKGIQIDYRIIRIPGAFVTLEVKREVTEIILEKLKQNKRKDNLSFYIHVQSHGQLMNISHSDLVRNSHEVEIKKTSPLNCGMLKATMIGIEMERLLILEKPEVNLNGRMLKIREEKDIRELLKQAYGYSGYLAGDWIRSIDDLSTHPRTQAAIMEKYIRDHSVLGRLNIRITAGIQDYALHSIVRLDGGTAPVPFYEDLQKSISRHSSENHLKDSEIYKQSEKQRPVAGLFSTTDSHLNGTRKAARYYQNRSGQGTGEKFLSNTVFVLSSGAFSSDSLPLDPYMAAGFYYSVVQLGLREYMVLGNNQIETNQMMKRIQMDPLLSLIIRKFKVKLTPLNQSDIVHIALDDPEG